MKYTILILKTERIQCKNRVAKNHIDGNIEAMEFWQKRIELIDADISILNADTKKRESKELCKCSDTEMWHLLTGMCCRCNKPTR